MPTRAADHPTDAWSGAYPTPGQRVRFCGRYVWLYTRPADVAFRILNRPDGNATASGGPEWDLQVAALIPDPDDLPDWEHGDPTPLKDVDLSWVWQLRADNPTGPWDASSRPEMLVRPDGGAITLIYRPERVVFKRITNLA